MNVVDPPAAAAAPPEPHVRGWLALVASTDHKSVGLRLIGMCAAFFLIGGLLALACAPSWPSRACSSSPTTTYDELFTMHGSTMVYLVMQPLALALGVYLVPLQIGAADLIAPRLTCACVWLLTAGGLIMYCGLPHRPRRRPRTAGRRCCRCPGRTYTPGPGWTCGSIGVALATSAAGAGRTIVLTIFLLRRAPGMTHAAAAGLLLDDAGHLPAGRWSRSRC